MMSGVGETPSDPARAESRKRKDCSSELLGPRYNLFIISLKPAILFLSPFARPFWLITLLDNHMQSDFLPSITSMLNAAFVSFQSQAEQREAQP